MVTVVVGTQNKRKLQSVENVLKPFIPEKTISLIPFSAKSLVPDTPWDKETAEGAQNRARHCKKDCPDADYWIGLESGLVNRYGQIYEEAWASIINRENKLFLGYSSGLKVPDYITKRMKTANMKHWEIMKILEEEHNLSSDDTWGNYSKEMIIRDISLQEAIRNTVVQIFAPKDSFYRM